MLPQQVFRISFLIGGLLFGSYEAYSMNQRENMPPPLTVMTPEAVAVPPAPSPTMSSTAEPTANLTMVNNKPKPQVTPKPTPSAGPSRGLAMLASVSPVEDLRTIGYPDSRKLAIGEDGTRYAAFRKKDSGSGSKSQIYIATSTDEGRSWRLANNGRPVSQGVGKYDQRVPSILVIGKTVHVTWYGVDDSLSGKDHREIKYVVSADGGKSFTKWRNIGTIDGYNGQDYWQEHPVIAAKNSSSLYIVWEGKDASHDKQQIKFSSSSDGGKSWSTPKNVSITQDRTQSRPVVIARGNDLYIFAYGFSSESHNRIGFTVSHDNGVSWQAWTPISSDSYDSRHVSVALDNQQHFHIVYRQTDGQKSWIIYRSSADGSNWSGEDRVMTSDLGQYFPSICVSNGTPYIAWTETGILTEPLPRENIGFPASGRIVKRTDNRFVEVTNQPLPGAWLTMGEQTAKPEILFISDTGSGHYQLNFAQFNL